MWKQRMGVSLGNHYSVPTKNVIKILKQIGFDAISPEWEKDVDIDALIKTAKEQGMYIQSLHSPYYGAADMWSENREVSEKVLNELFEALKVCHNHKIPILVVHCWIGFDNIPVPTEAGLENYGRLIERAKKYGINVAFENTEGLEHLEAVMERFKSEECVGFCWDSGHEMCYNYSKDLLGRFGDRLIMTHLNDNLGISSYDGKTFWTDDLHLLPYDGIADWDYNIQRLKKSNRQEILNFELNIKSKPGRYDNKIYEKMTIEEYFTEAYKRACKIASRLIV